MDPSLEPKDVVQEPPTPAPDCSERKKRGRGRPAGSQKTKAQEVAESNSSSQVPFLPVFVEDWDLRLSWHMD